MKNKALSIFLGGMVVTLGLCVAPAVYAEEPLPDHDQLGSQITADANTQVSSSLTTGTDQSATQSDTTQTSQPANDTLFINTGDDARVDNSSDQSSTTTVENDNEANLEQQINASANTGGNSASRNISFGGDAGVITTGDAAVYSELEAAANSNQTGVNGTCSSPSSDASIVNTGDDLDYQAGSSSDCTTTVTNGNGAAINQVVNADANTGDNVADRNISFGGDAGVITTGNATVGSLLVTRANQNLVIVGGSSSHGGPGSGASIYFVNTGDNAEVNAGSEFNSDINVSNNNYAVLDQLVDVEANTGGNDASRNINQNGDAGVITTGDAVVYTAVEADANHNHTLVNTASATNGGTTVTDIVNTGDDLDVDTSSEVNADTSVTNTNTADVDQEVNVVANTGNNTADRNIAFNGDAGVITTGDAIIVTELEVEVNSNQTLISETAPNATQNSTTDIVNTGDNLDVDVSNQTNTSTTVTNTNTANVNQTVNAVANTGNNTASNNIGQSSMTTGNVTITTEIITNANNNYTFIVDSNVNGLELFKQFVEAFLGMDWEDLVNGSNGQNSTNNSVAIVNTGDNATVLAEQVQNRDVVVNNTNYANVDQNVNVHANTGNNTCNANIGDCKITTGNATIWTQLIANLNNNFTFIGKVQLPKPETPVVPETPVTPEKPVQPAEVVRPQPQVLGESLARPQAVLAATTLPMTGGYNLALLGLVLIGGGLSLRLKKAQA